MQGVCRSPQNDDVRKQPVKTHSISYGEEMERDDLYYEALRARDPRFDGKFFVGVRTTGIYCRPICPAKPKRENVEFFPTYLAAEKAGYRPCLRCRPESAPLSAAWIGTSAVVQRALRKIHAPGALDFDEDGFAELFGLSARHLRRLFIDETGKTPKQISFENRLNLSRKLLVETALPITEVVFASGFKSVRRFNDAFKQRFKKSPSEIRRNPLAPLGALKVSLPYRPPFDFEGLLHFYRSHQMGNLEWFDADAMHRVVEWEGKVGHISISNNAAQSQLIVEIDFPTTAVIHSIISRVRSLFDLDSDPVLIANQLELDPKVKEVLKKHPGIRLPSGWDPFEVAVGTILGQLVSVRQARSLVQDLIEMLGRDSGLKREGKPILLFPTPRQIAASSLDGLGTTSARKKALIEFSEAIAKKRISLEPTQDLETFLQKLLSLRGIGPWTAHYIALKALRNADVFPETDLILARALEIHPKNVVDKMSPWRGYGAALFWKEYSDTLKKRNHP